MVGSRFPLCRPVWPLRVIMILIFALAASPARADCEDLLPRDSPRRAEAPRVIRPDDLLRLRDIGQPDSSLMRQPSPFGVSPDGRQVAFFLRRADPASDTYCIGLVVVRLDGSAAPRLVDLCGEVILSTTVDRGMVMPVGLPLSPRPIWSPDGRWIAFLRRDERHTQLWRVPVAGGRAQAMTHEAVDVEEFSWSSDGHRLVYSIRPDAAAAETKTDAEGLVGWLYDARILPNIAARPRPPGNLDVQIKSVDVESGTRANAGSQDTARLRAMGGEADLAAVAANGRKAFTRRDGPEPLSPVRIVASDAEGRPTICQAAACARDVLGLWWDRSGRELRFLRREGWARETMALYGWVPGGRSPRVILRTQDVLIGCTPRDDDLLCLAENATTPRHIVSVGLANGRDSKVFDPNPEFAAIRLGKVERLRWRNDRGLEAWGDLVLPPGYRGGKHLPLIVVQYHSDGFLRGGTGDEYPIQLFAARGFAVLSVERPAFFAESVPGLKSWTAFNAANMKDWAERRSLLSSLLAGIEMATARGLVDPQRIGITGLSDGASTARFALINAPIFAAASISSCCVDARTAMSLAGTSFADLQREMGAPTMSRPDDEYWRPYSTALNASTLNRPLLMQLADSEYILGLESFTALREAGQPVEMHVFPGEYHIKWQPAHRQAIYERNLDWFSFWLQDRKDPAPSKTAQYARWDEMRARMRSGSSR